MSHPRDGAFVRERGAQGPLRVVLSWFTPGNPAPQGSKRHIGNGRMIESSKYVGPWRQTVALFARKAARESGAFIEHGPVNLELGFVMPRPLSTPKSKTPAAVKRPDVDKLARAVLDALTGAVFKDDSQVIELRAHKRIAEHGEEPGVQIRMKGEL